MAATWFTLTDTDVNVAQWNRSRISRGRKTVTVNAMGFVFDVGRPLYAHNIRGGKVKTVRVGALTGDCGDLTARMKHSRAA